MKNKRRKYNQAEELCLLTQVNSICPLCGSALFYDKSDRSYKNYELAHIYPLNPTPTEIEELKNEALLHSDINHPDNIIPLCPTCHGKYDKPRTAEEYRKLSALKESSIRRSKLQELQHQYQLESDIQKVIEGLNYDNNTIKVHDLDFDPKRLWSSPL